MSIALLLLLLLVVVVAVLPLSTAGLPLPPLPPPPNSTVWLGVEDGSPAALAIHGRGWPAAQMDSPFHRLPAAAKVTRKGG